MLVLDPAKRYTAKQAVMHPFIVLNCGPPPNAVEPIPKEISQPYNSSNNQSYVKKKEGNISNKETSQEYYNNNKVPSSNKQYVQTPKDSMSYGNNNSNNLAPGVTKKLQQVLSNKNFKVYILFYIILFIKTF